MRETGSGGFTDTVCKAFASVGAFVVVNHASRVVNSVPDRSIISVYGNWFVEFKGVRTPIRTGQKMWMERANLRFPCAFVLRQSADIGLLQTPAGGTLRELDLLKPRETLQSIRDWLDSVPWVFAGVSEERWNQRKRVDQ